jgi:VWFA-related protein
VGIKKLSTALILLLLAAGPLAGQDPANQASQSGNNVSTAPERIAVRVNLVNVLFTATDNKNRLVLDLTKDDFHVFEDKKPQDVRFFSRESNLPLRIGILIDTSNSVRDRLRFEQESAIDFLTTTLRPGKDLAYVLGFDVEAQVVQDYTEDMEKLAKAIRGLRAGGGTGLYDAVYFACKEKMLFFPPPEPYLRRVMILIGDGMDNQSVHTREEALAMAQRAEVTIFAISTNRTGAPVRGDKVLKRLAEETGGRAFFPFSVGDLAHNFQEIARELRSQYSLAYVSSNTTHDGTFRRITIDPLEKNVKVRSKTGYFAPSQ